MTMAKAQRRHYIIEARKADERALREKIAQEVEDFCEERHSPTGQHCSCGSIEYLIAPWWEPTP